MRSLLQDQIHHIHQVWCVCVRKKGSLRPCVDYKSLNAKTVADRHPIPRVQDFWKTLVVMPGSLCQTKERLTTRDL